MAELALQLWPYFGDKECLYSENTNVTGSTPKGLWILDQYIEVHSWRDVLEQTMNVISELEPEKLEHLIQQFPRFISRDPNKFHAIRTLKDGNYIEVNLSAKSIESFCFQAIQAVDLSIEDWKVEIA